MGKKKASTNLSAKQLYQSAVAAAEASVGSSTLLYVDPRRIRYEHSTIKRQFTGVGGSVEAAYDDIKAGRMRAEQLPPIQVLVGTEYDEGGPWYYSLNNRRLWVLKRLREDGLLEGGVVGVRVRAVKSGKERDRFTVANCSLEARFMKERGEGRKKGGFEGGVEGGEKDVEEAEEKGEAEEAEEAEEDESESEEEPAAVGNGFGALGLDSDSDSD